MKYNMAVHLSRMKQRCFAVTATGLGCSVWHFSVLQWQSVLCLFTNFIWLPDLSRKILLWNRNELSACYWSLDVTTRVYRCMEAHRFCGIKCFCLIQWLSAGFCWDRSAARQSLGRNTGLSSGSTDLLPLMNNMFVWLNVCSLSKFKLDLMPLNKSLFLLKSWLIRKI